MGRKTDRVGPLSRLIDLLPQTDPGRKEWGRLHAFSSVVLLVRILASTALFVRFSLPMAREKYDPHTVRIFINGSPVAALEDLIPEGQHVFRFPATFLRLGVDAPAENTIEIETEGMGAGQYIVVTDFRVVVNLDRMAVEACVALPRTSDWEEVPPP
ncbi:MAG: hypothetical protein HGA84_05285, partial [Syntrophobacteraceae bacterium]|nr:hypothetical protein [Syntrophobacteraceae bacterium]